MTNQLKVTIKFYDNNDILLSDDTEIIMTLAEWENLGEDGITTFDVPENPPRAAKVVYENEVGGSYEFNC